MKSGHVRCYGSIRDVRVKLCYSCLVSCCDVRPVHVWIGIRFPVFVSSLFASNGSLVRETEAKKGGWLSTEIDGVIPRRVLSVMFITLVKTSLWDSR